jgi:hypothetical protein
MRVYKTPKVNRDLVYRTFNDRCQVNDSCYIVANLFAPDNGYDPDDRETIRALAHELAILTYAPVGLGYHLFGGYGYHKVMKRHQRMFRDYVRELNDHIEHLYNRPEYELSALYRAEFRIARTLFDNRPRLCIAICRVLGTEKAHIPCDKWPSL